MTGVLLAAAYTALLLLWMRRTRFFGQVPGLHFRWVAAFFLLRIGAGVALWAIYTYVYPDRATADVFKYFDDSAHMYKSLAENPWDYLRMITGIGNDAPHFRDLYYKDMNNWVRHYESDLYNDAHTIIRFNAIVRLFSFGEFHVHSMVTAFLSLTGLVGLYRAFVRSVPGKEGLLAVAIFLLPSVLFWASGVLKESLLFFGIGLLMYQVDRALHGNIRWRDPLLLAFNVVMLFFLKFYVLLSLLPALILLVWARKRTRPALWMKMTLLYGVFILLGLNLHYLLPGWDILNILMMKQRDFIGLAIHVNSGSFAMPELLFPDPWSFIKQAPSALSVALLGPVLHPSGGVFGILSAVENMFFVLFLMVCIVQRRPWSSVDKPLLAMIVLYVVLLALVIGWTTPVMGAVVRYRTPLLPFLLVAGLLVLDHSRMAKWLPWSTRSFA